MDLHKDSQVPAALAGGLPHHETRSDVPSHLGIRCRCYDVNFIDETWADIIEGVADGRLSRDQLADIIRRALPRRTRR